MKLKIASAVLLAAVAGSALAESPTVAAAGPFVSTKTRAEVQADLRDYQRSGANPWTLSYNHLDGFKSSVTRAQVVAEYLAARNEVDAIDGEDSGSAYLAQASAKRARAADVIAGQPVNAK